MNLRENWFSNERPGDDDADALEWRCAQYLTDELTEAEALVFEERLANDPSVRDALVRSLDLIQMTWLAIDRELETDQPGAENKKALLRAAQAPKQPSLSGTTPGAKTWPTRPVVLALASSIVVFVALGWVWNPGWNSGERSEESWHSAEPLDSLTAEQAIVWAELVAESNDGAWTAWLDVELVAAQPVARNSASNQRPAETGNHSSGRGSEAFEFSDDWIMALVGMEESEQEALQ